MVLADWIGTIGVLLLLTAFLLNLLNKISQAGLPYILLNFAGASLACLASVLINYIPFIVLEGAWAIVSLIALVKVVTKRSN